MHDSWGVRIEDRVILNGFIIRQANDGLWALLIRNMPGKLDDFIRARKRGFLSQSGSSWYGLTGGLMVPGWSIEVETFSVQSAGICLTKCTVPRILLIPPPFHLGLNGARFLQFVFLHCHKPGDPLWNPSTRICVPYLTSSHNVPYVSNWLRYRQ